MVRRLASSRNSRLAEVVCKNVFGLLVERTPGHDEDSRAPVLIKGTVSLKAPFFITGLGRAVRLFRHLVGWCLADRGRCFCNYRAGGCVPARRLPSPLARTARSRLGGSRMLILSDTLKKDRTRQIAHSNPSFRNPSVGIISFRWIGRGRLKRRRRDGFAFVTEEGWEENPGLE
jgi:hypothetical protein